MAFGSKFNRDNAESEGGSVSTISIWNFQSGSTTVRFLDDLDDWTEYWEHYDNSVGKRGAFFPCLGKNDGCPGCEKGLSSSHKWLVNAYVLDSDSEKGGKGYTNLFKFPKSLMTKVMRHYDRVGTLLTHDYEIIKSGTGMDTEYDMERGEKTPFDAETRQPYMIDHEEALQAAYDAYTGKKVTDRVVPKEPSFDEKAKAAKDAGDPPFDLAPAAEAPAAQTKGEEEVPEEEVTEEALRAMEREEIDSLIKRAGLTAPDLDTVDEMVDWLIKEIGD